MKTAETQLAAEQDDDHRDGRSHRDKHLRPCTVTALSFGRRRPRFAGQDAEAFPKCEPWRRALLRRVLRQVFSVDRTGTAAQERWNLRYYHNWEDYRALLSDGSYQKSAFEMLDWSTVYVYTITPKGEPTQSPATVAFTPECDVERSRVLSYNFNGFDYDEKTGALQYSFFVCQEGMHVLAVLGEDFSGYTVQGYPDGGCDPAEALDTLSADVTREEMTLCAFLKEILSEMPRHYYSESEQTPENQALFYRAAVDFLLSYGALSDDPAERYDSWGGRLDDMFMDAYAVDRVSYAAFEVDRSGGRVRHSDGNAPERGKL